MRAQYKILHSFVFAVILNLGFAPPLNPPAGNWYQQFMPNLHGASIVDIKFTDSLTGYAVTNLDSFSNACILKTTNGGDNWIVNLTDDRAFTRLAFINSNTGFVTRGFVAGNNMIYKTTNGGNNWSDINMPEVGIANDISVLNEDTIWVADNAALDGGIFRTTDGGLSWIRQFTGGGVNPTRIYMYNWNIGFMVFQSNLLYKTTNSGDNWFPVPGGGYSDIYFIDSLTGWKANGDMKKTTDGGLSWTTQTLPTGGIIWSSGIASFSVLNRDTIGGSGALVSYGPGRIRGILYRTINGGNNWLFQIPDTGYNLGIFYKVQFLNQNIGWGFGRIANSTPTIFSNIHTTNGGDTTFLTGMQQISGEMPKEFKLYQNYPNPFNPRTVIKYEVRSQMSEVRLVVYDISGREILVLVNESQGAGTYEVDFSGNGLSSGVYFYQIMVKSPKGGEVYRETRKAILIK